MRTIKFGDILADVAYKMGLDPDQGNFLTNQAIPIGTYVSQWVRRLYDLRDWPELVVTHKFAPQNHVVTWDAAALDLESFPGDTTGVVVHLGRILKVFLTDPADSNGASVSTSFTILEQGIHCGFEHGAYVWIRYMGSPPLFSAVVWDSDATYHRDELAYSPVSRECYRSRSGGNAGNDPSFLHLTPLTPVTTQDFDPGHVAIAEQSKSVRLDYNGVVLFGTRTVTQVVANIFDAAGITLVSASHVVVPGDTTTTVFADIKTQLIAALPPAYSVTQDVTGQFVEIVHTSNFSATGFYYYLYPPSAPVPPPSATFGYMVVIVFRIYIAPVAAIPLTRQLTEIVLGSDEIVQGATYTLTIIDSLGHLHIADYVAAPSDGANEILIGMSQAITDGGVIDVWLRTVYPSVDTVNSKLTLSFAEVVSVDASFEPSDSQWWDLVEFPAAIAEQVVTGAYADLLKEWGQTDKGTAEEGRVPAETSISEANFTPTPQPPLSGQQVPASRYKV